MALSDSALSELLDALRAGNGTDLVRELAQWALQQLIEAEAACGKNLVSVDSRPLRAKRRSGDPPQRLACEDAVDQGR